MIDSTNGDGSPIDNDAQSIQRAYDDLDKAFAKPVLANDADGFDEALIRLEMKLRYNELSERAELFRYDERSHDDRWMTWNTHERSWVIHEIRRRFHTRTRKGDIVQLYFRRDDADLAINTLLRDRHVNPFLDEWINVLPEWDGTPRLGSWLSDLFEVEDPDDALLVWASRFVFLGAVWRAFKPGTKLDETPILIGPQGIGKSTAIRMCLPPDYPFWFTDGLHLGADRRRGPRPCGVV